MFDPEGQSLNNLCLVEMDQAVVESIGSGERKPGSGESIWDSPGLRGFLCPLHQEEATGTKVECPVEDVSRL